jgi:hypothetical protein
MLLSSLWMEQHSMPAVGQIAMRSCEAGIYGNGHTMMLDKEQQACHPIG